MITQSEDAWTMRRRRSAGRINQGSLVLLVRERQWGNGRGTAGIRTISESVSGLDLRLRTLCPKN